MTDPTDAVTCELTTMKVGLSKRRVLVKMKAGTVTDVYLFRKHTSEADELKALSELQEAIDTGSKFRSSIRLVPLENVKPYAGWE